MVTTTPPGETRSLLENISWQTFKTMLAEMGNERKSRLAYDQGKVEIITPLMPHENSKWMEKWQQLTLFMFGWGSNGRGDLDSQTADNFLKEFNDL